MPCSRCAGYHDRHPAAARHFFACSPDRLIGQRPGRNSAGIEPVQFLFLFDPYNGKRITAQTIGGRFTDRHGRSRCNSSIHCVAACLHGIQARLRSERLRGADHAVARIDQFPAGRKLSAVPCQIQFHPRILPHKQFFTIFFERVFITR